MKQQHSAVQKWYSPQELNHGLDTKFQFVPLANLSLESIEIKGSWTSTDRDDLNSK